LTDFRLAVFLWNRRGGAILPTMPPQQASVFPSAVAMYVPSESGKRRGATMIELYDNEVGVLIGTITEEQLEFLIDELEETSTTDQDYYLDESMLDMLEEAGADDTLMDLLRGALGDREDIEIRWERV
jgi:processive 1,2-diacylglycerol beta-glucosyltransferase